MAHKRIALQSAVVSFIKGLLRAGILSSPEPRGALRI